MWINSEFLKNLASALDNLSNGTKIDTKDIFQEFNSNKYSNIIKSLQKTSDKMEIDIEDISILLKDSNIMNQAARDGQLDVRIDTKQYKNGDFVKIADGINRTMETTLLALRDMGEQLDKLSYGDLNLKINNSYKGDYKILQDSINNLSTILNINDIENMKQNWLKNGISNLNKLLSGENTIQEVSSKAINYLSNYLNAGIGALYIYDSKENLLVQNATYAFIQKENISTRFKLGEGIVGQVALQKSPIQLKNIKRSFMTIDTGTTSEPPLNLYTFPLIYKDELFGVIEIGTSEMFDNYVSEFFTQSNQIIAAALSSAISHREVEELLYETQIKNNKIKEANSQLEEQQQELEEQKQKLEEINVHMEEQKEELEERNELLIKSQKELDKQTNELKLSGKYKSEFLANMSHELRTPLNSIILLSEMLAENKKAHLEVEEVKKAQIIHNSGNELLRLINDVLDLSKVEAGKMDIIVDEFQSSDFIEEFAINFEYQAKEKHLNFIVKDNYKDIMKTDKDKLSQVLRNFISNSLKFTKQGNITLSIEKHEDEKIKISLSDTGIGIAKDKLKFIFKAFQQEDGTTSREYGGTGLGLTISQKIIKLLGGEISLESTQGKGSTFSIIIPNLELNQEIPKIDNKKQEVIKDDRDIITLVDKPFLIIEDNVNFAQTLKEKINENKNYALIALNGKDGLNLASKYNLKGVMLDLGLPDINGIDVLSEFKTDINLKNIPIYVISGQDKDIITKRSGAIGFSHKPVSNDEIDKIIDKINQFNNKTIKDLLVVEDSEIQRETLIEYIGNGTIKSHGVATVKDAKSELKRGIYDGIILDLKLPDGSGFDICSYIQKAKLDLPIIVYTGKTLTKAQETRLRKYTDSIIVKTASSQKRLLSEVDMFMHRVEVNVGEKYENLQDISLNGAKVLIADDDIRNIYLLSEILICKGASVITAGNGKEAVDLLNKNIDTDIILMDIMMPIMDGYEATKLIKANNKTKDIPVIAVSAKSMDKDKKKALEVGVVDYITKPIKTNILIAIIKGWLNKNK